MQALSQPISAKYRPEVIQSEQSTGQELANQSKIQARCQPIRTNYRLEVSLTVKCTCSDLANQGKDQAQSQPIRAKTQLGVNQNKVLDRSQPIRVGQFLPIRTRCMLRVSQSEQRTLGVTQFEPHTGQESGNLSTLWARIQPIIAVNRVCSTQSDHRTRTLIIRAIQGRSQPIRESRGQEAANQGNVQAPARPIRAKDRLGVSQSEQCTIQSQTIRAVCNFKSANQCREMLRVFNRAIYMIGVSHSEQCTGQESANQSNIQIRSQLIRANYRLLSANQSKVLASSQPVSSEYKLESAIRVIYSL